MSNIDDNDMFFCKIHTLLAMKTKAGGGTTAQQHNSRKCNYGKDKGLLQQNHNVLSTNLRSRH
jgi:hypothetical protein